MKNMELIFSGFGIVIEKDNDTYYLSFYTASSVCSKEVTYKISPDDAEKAQVSEQDAYEVCLKYEK